MTVIIIINYNIYNLCIINLSYIILYVIFKNVNKIHDWLCSFLTSIEDYILFSVSLMSHEAWKQVL